MRKVFNSYELRDYILEIAKGDDEIKQQRLYLSISTYRLIDWRRGQQRGPKQETFRFEFILKELIDKKSGKRTEKNVKEILQSMLMAVRFAKQFEIGLYVKYPRPGSGENLRIGGLEWANRELFLEEKKLVNLYSDFIHSTINLYQMISPHQ